MSPDHSSDAPRSRVLVTGATGTTGMRLVPRLAAAGLEVLAASRGLLRASRTIESVTLYGPQG